MVESLILDHFIPSHTALEGSIFFLVILAIVIRSVAAVSSMRPFSSLSGATLHRASLIIIVACSSISAATGNAIIGFILLSRFIATRGRLLMLRDSLIF